MSRPVLAAGSALEGFFSELVMKMTQTVSANWSRFGRVAIVVVDATSGVVLAGVVVVVVVVVVEALLLLLALAHSVDVVAVVVGESCCERRAARGCRRSRRAVGRMRWG